MKDKTDVIIILFIFVSLVVSAVIYGSVNSNQKVLTEEEKYMLSLRKEKIDEYLYSIRYTDYDYNLGNEYMNQKYSINLGGCSTVRNGIFFGRNYDWYYEDAIEFIVRVTKTNNRHASIGMAYSSFTNLEASQNTYDERYKIIPFFTVDGVNDSGVAVTINVVPTGDKGYTTGTNPDGEDLITLMIPRFILDNASSVDEAISLLREKNIYTPLTNVMAQEFHFMISDKNKNVVIEFINNEMVVLEDENIMTNFYLSDFDSNNLPNHAMGIERYNILLDGYSDSNSQEGMINLMKKVFYSKAYDFNTNPFWYSEFSGDYHGLDLTTKNVGEPFLDGDLSKAGAYQPFFEKIKELYPNRTRDKTFWLTNHMSVYDLENKTLTVIVQENNIEHRFSL